MIITGLIWYACTYIIVGPAVQRQVLIGVSRIGLPGVRNKNTAKLRYICMCSNSMTAQWSVVVDR